MPDIKVFKNIAKNFTVLYIEDEVQLRESVLLYLKKIFINVTTANNGLDGLKAYKKSFFDIVITDVQMPYMDGLEMAKKMKNINPDQEIIIISAYSESSYFIDAIRMGISDYIVKPVDYIQMNNVLYKSVLKLKQFNENREYKLHLEEMVSKRTTEIISLEKEKIDTFENVLLAFVELLEERDTYTGGHSQRVAYYCRLIAKKMLFSDDDCELIYEAGILHDIGKIVTPDTILLKPGKLNDLEYKLIQEHVQVGYDLLNKIEMYKDIAEIILCHHEYYNGEGYPRGLSADSIPPLARIMIVADAFDAMTTNRIYKARKDVAEAVEDLKKLSGKQFDPEVVKVAVEVLSDIEILDSISQLPTTEIERERFSYFYRDQITDAFNTEYLDFILNRDYYEKEYSCINVLYIHNFSHFNKKYGWNDGDIFLKKFANYLQDTFALSLIFRFHGDDFILVSKECLTIDMNQFESLDLLDKKYISISKLHINLKKNRVKNLKELEELI
jgi:putative nucleotidyltransferase with HDIG domain